MYIILPFKSFSYILSSRYLDFRGILVAFANIKLLSELHRDYIVSRDKHRRKGVFIIAIWKMVEVIACLKALDRSVVVDFRKPNFGLFFLLLSRSRALLAQRKSPFFFPKASALRVLAWNTYAGPKGGNDRERAILFLSVSRSAQRGEGMSNILNFFIPTGGKSRRRGVCASRYV